MKRHNDINDYEEYIKVLENHGIKDARIKLENMFILDFSFIRKVRFQEEILNPEKRAQLSCAHFN